MTDDLQQELARMLRDRVADMPTSHDVAPATVAHVRRRRAVKLGAFATAVLVVVAGTTAAVAQAAHKSPDRVTTAESTTIPTNEAGTVPTIVCPVSYSLTPDQPLPPPATVPRTVSVGGADGLVSYAATTDERYVVLGPNDWACSATIGADGQNGIDVYAPHTIDGPGAVSVVNDFLWHGGVGSTLACSASDDPAVTRYVVDNSPESRPCPRPGRTVTRLDVHTETFVDDDGSRGASWIALPSRTGADDGKVSVLTCQPIAGLTTANCDTIVADWVARMGASDSNAPTTGPDATAVPTT